MVLFKSLRNSKRRRKIIFQHTKQSFCNAKIFFLVYLFDVSIHRKFDQNWFLNECARMKKAKILQFQSYFVRYRRTQKSQLVKSALWRLKDQIHCLNYFVENYIITHISHLYKSYKCTNKINLIDFLEQRISKLSPILKERVQEKYKFSFNKITRIALIYPLRTFLLIASIIS